jgi:hypothetical protein
MKTTVEIAGPLLKRAKSLASRRGTTLRALIEQGLRHVLDGREESRPTLRDARVDGKGLQPEFVGADWDQVRDAAYGVEEA